MQDAKKDLELLVRSRHQLIVIETTEESRVEELIHRVSVGLRMPLLTWSSTQGLRKRGQSGHFADSLNMASALDHAERFRQPAIFVFKDLHTYLHEARVVRRVLDVKANFEGRDRCLIMLGANMELPPAIRQVAAEFVMPLPKEDELRKLAWRVLHDFSPSQPVSMGLDRSELDQLIDTLKGMTLLQAERALCRAVADDLALTADDLPGVLEAKREVLQEQGVLEYVPVDISMSELGGLANLKDWLGKRRNALGEEAKEFGLPPPRGVVLLGVQGCGKSLAAKAVAADWELPLLRMEAGRIYDKFIGESDKKLEQALRAAEHMAPCIMWIDEIEKAFAFSGSADSDGGLSQRIFGRLLSWLQEKQTAVFVVATCNDVQSLPPELMRKGRFDEIFFIDLPDAAERKQIFEVHISKRNREPAFFHLDALVAASEGFSGAEIEQAVVAALYTAFAAKAELDTETLLSELASTKPLSVTRAESVTALRTWADGRAVPA